MLNHDTELKIIYDYIHKLNITVHDLCLNHSISTTQLYQIIEKHGVPKSRKKKEAMNRTGKFYNPSKKNKFNVKDYLNSRIIYVDEQQMVYACSIGIPFDQQTPMHWLEYQKYTYE